MADGWSSGNDYIVPMTRALTVESAKRPTVDCREVGGGTV